MPALSQAAEGRRAMIPRTPSLERIHRYVREAVIDGVSVAAVMAGGRTDRASTLVRWRVWSRLRAERYSLQGIAHHFNVDHSTVGDAMRQIAKGVVPYAGCRNQRIPKVPRAPKVVRIPKPRPVPPIRYVGCER